jgi:site-specific recombinase XerD
MRAQQAPNRHMRPFHSVKSVYAEHSINDALKAGQLTADDARLIRDFVAEIKATRGIGVSRANKLTYSLVSWRQYIGPFRTNTVADLYRGLEALREARHDNIPYKQNTLKDHIVLLKRFFRWLRANGYSTVPADKIEGIRAPKADRMTKTAGQLLTEDEVRAMIDACQNSRDRAVIATIYEGSFRVQELGRLTWSQVKFDDYGTVINVDEKTGAPRYVRLVAATQYLIQWKNDFPFPVTPDALVFVSNRRLPVQYSAVAVQLKKIARRAGIRKKISPHIFRHSRITEMIRQGYSESIVKRMAWGNIDSTMFSRYLHLVDNDTDNEVLEKHGIRRPEERRSDAMEVRQCASCNTVNPPTFQFCSTCGEPLTEKVRMSMERLRRDIEKTPEYQEIVGVARRKLAAVTGT